jgi:hypothetical protein
MEDYNAFIGFGTPRNVSADMIVSVCVFLLRDRKYGFYEYF